MYQQVLLVVWWGLSKSSMWRSMELWRVLVQILIDHELGLSGEAELRTLRLLMWSVEISAVIDGRPQKDPMVSHFEGVQWRT